MGNLCYFDVFLDANGYVTNQKISLPFTAFKTQFSPCQVVIIAGDCETYVAKDSKVRTYKCPDELAKLDPVHKIDDLMLSYFYCCDAVLGNPESINEIKSSDAVIGDAMYLCSSLIADKFSLPHVTVVMGPLSVITTILPYGFADLPSYIPQVFSGMTDRMDFLQRAENTLRWFLDSTTFPYKISKVYATLKEKHNITPEKTLQQTFQKVDLVLVQTEAFDYPRPYLPSKNHSMLFTIHFV